MKAKLGNKVVDVWKISIEHPNTEDWLLDEFENEQLSWSGKLVMKKKMKESLKENKIEGKAANPKESAWSWILLYSEIGSFSNVLPHDIYLIVNQPRVPSYGRIGDYLVKSPAGGLVVFSKEKAARELTFL